MVAVADHRHFGRAANAVFVSQPTLSGQIKKLEERLGLKIFERTTRGVSITPIGEQIIAEARCAIKHSQNIENLAAAQSETLSGEIRLGIIPTISPYLVPYFLTEAINSYPDMSLSLHEDKTETLLAMLEASNIDAAIIATDELAENLQEIELYSEEFLFLCPAGHDLAKKPEIVANDIIAEELLLLPEGHCLRDQTLELCHIDSRVASKQLDLTDAGLQTVIELVRTGKGYSFLPKLAAIQLGKTDNLLVKQFLPKPERLVRMVFRKSFPRKSCLHALSGLISDTPKLISDLQVDL